MEPTCPVCLHQYADFFYKKGAFRYFSCPKCHLIFINPTPSRRQIAALYSRHYEFIVDDRAGTRFKEQADTILNTIHATIPDATTLLDVGAGYGTFVNAATGHGFTAVGLEPAQNLYKQAYRHKANVLNTDFGSYFKTHKKKTFDVISMIHVIEHLRTPEQSLHEIFQHLNPGGILFIETPNADSHLFQAEGHGYTFLTPPDHIHLFSPRALEHMVLNVRQNVSIKAVTYSYPEHLVGILRRVKRREFGKSSPATRARRRKTIPGKSAPAPFFDRHIAPALTPLLNIGNKGSILQMYIQLR